MHFITLLLCILLDILKGHLFQRPVHNWYFPKKIAGGHYYGPNIPCYQKLATMYN